MALPLLDQIKKLSGADHVTVLARRTSAPLVAHHPDVDELILLEDDISKIGGIRKAVKAVKTGGYDAGLILPPSFSSALIFYLGQVPTRIGYATDRRSLLLTGAVSLPKEIIHRSMSYLNLVSKLSGQRRSSSSFSLPLAPDQNQQPLVRLSEQDSSNASGKLRQAGIMPGDSYLIISPRAVAPSRRWGTDNYGALANQLIEKNGSKVVLIGGSADREAGDSVARFAPDNIVNLCGETTLMEAAAVISMAKLFIGNDSGLAHLAGSVGCPVVVLSGADNMIETSPATTRKTVIVKELPCIGCVKNNCPLSGEDFMLCMKQVTVDEVADAALKWLQA